MTLCIRQIALVARDLEPAVQSLREHLAIDISHRDPGVGLFGLHNAVMPVGTTFLEVVSPTREGTSAGRLLERRGGDGGYMIMLQTDSLARERARFAELGVREVFSVTEADIDEVRGILDGHLVLDRRIAERGRYPALDVLASLSRVMSHVASDEHQNAARSLREALGRYETKRDLIELGAYAAGADPRLDRVISAMPDIEAYLRQAPGQIEEFGVGLGRLAELVKRHDL